MRSSNNLPKIKKIHKIDWFHTGDRRVDLVKEICLIRPGFVPAPDHANLLAMGGKKKTKPEPDDSIHLAMDLREPISAPGLIEIEFRYVASRSQRSRISISKFIDM